MSKLFLKPEPTLQDCQAYVAEMVAERGFSRDIAKKFMMLFEEVGEFAKASRKRAGMRLAKDSAEQDVAAEAADVFLVLLDLCNLMDIDLEQAFRDKEERNKQRAWE